MKLTLRTLLSWKDGMLPADVEREIAGKVAASPVAGRLAARIDAVVADPALPAPGAGGSAVDPNTTSEYLDNVLAGHVLEEFERGCIANGNVLAEVAACHEMLAELARQSAVEATLDADGRTMLLTAVRARAAIRGIALPPGAARSTAAAGGLRAEPEWPVTAEPDAAPAAGAPAAAPVITLAAPARATPRSGVAPASAWLFAIAALVLLATLVGVLGWSLSRGAGRRVREVAERGPVTVAAEDAAPAPADEPARSDEPAPPDEPMAPLDDSPAAPPPVADAVNAPDAVASADAVAPAAQPSAVAPETAPAAPTPPVPGALPVSVPPAADVSVPQGDALAIAAPAAADMPPAAFDGTAPPAAGPDAAPRAGVVVGGDAAVLWRPHDDPGAAWATAPPAAEIGLPVDLLAPAFCHPAVVVDGVRIDLEPAARAVISRDAEGTPRLTLLRGFAVVTAARADAVLGVSAERLVGTATAPPGATFGVEVERRRLPGDDAVETRARIVAPRGGGLAWRQTEADGAPRGVLLQGVAAEVTLDGSAALEWRDTAAESATVASLPAAPRWLTARGDVLDRAAARALTAALAGNADPRAALASLAGDRRAEHRLAATATLALLGDVGPLVDLLCSEDPRRMLSEGQWTKLVAAGAAPLAGTDADTLARAFVDRGPPGAGESLARLAAGFSDAELEAGADAELVAALESPHLVVRRFAIANLVEIVKPTPVERLEYRADRPAEMLRAGAAWWRARQQEGRIRRVAAPPAPAG